MNQKDLMGLAEEIVAGIAPNIEQLKAIAAIKDSNAYILFPGADMIRNNWFGREVHLCMILNGKSGKCSEDCCFCSQSAFSNTDAP
ncbi:MAG: biotin synthase BioB, partial [Thermodesulfobacteriota bacterium]|nr:biotin synthase BioB [Thermodesulfobacteriota bacterium]